MGTREAGCDFVVVGGGIVGLTVAMEIRRRWSGASVVLLEKESECGTHASGRNSGVLHAGFYYTSESLKARFSRIGNRELTEYCHEKGLPINQCGKLVVARSEDELDSLAELFRRASTNGVMVEKVLEEELPQLEPEARTFGAALFSPTTSSVEPRSIIGSLVSDASDLGVRIETGSAFLRHVEDQVITTHGTLKAGYVVNAAGVHADTIAHDYGFGEEYGILPFRGLYLEYVGAGPTPRRHVYPVPALDNPFLGVHWTTTADGRVRIGPTAAPALWREHYRGTENLKLRELLEIGIRESGLWLRDSSGFRRLAWNEFRKQGRRHLLALARQLVSSTTAPGAWSWGPPGVRAQLVNTRTRRLEMDFKCMGDDQSFHILNAVSPAFTCAFPFARHVVDEVESLVSTRGPTNPVPIAASTKADAAHLLTGSHRQ